MSADELSTRNTNKTVCPICGGAGFIRLKVPIGHPQFGKAIPCRCKREEIREKRLARLRRMSNLQHLTRMTFATFDAHRHESPEVIYSLVDALNAAKEFAAHPDGWIVFTGPYGSGKTHLAVSIANYRMEQGLPVLFVVVPDLLDYLRAAYAPNSEITYDERFEQVRSIDLLVLDDLGTQNATPWAAEKLYQLLNYRYNAELPTVITTNQTLADMDPRLASRFKDQNVVKMVPIYASDFRIQGKEEAFGSLNLYNGMTFETFSDRRDELKTEQAKRHLREVKRAVERYAEAPGNWLILRGDFGVGKTHLAAAVANKVVRGGKGVLFIVVSDLLDHLRATFQPGSAVTYDQRFNEVRRAWLLVLDDMGAQSSSPWAQEKLFQIVNYRYVAGLPTILTISNESWEHLDERLKSRFLDSAVCQVIDINVPSYRGKMPQAAKPQQTTRQR